MICNNMLHCSVEFLHLEQQFTDTGHTLEA